MLNIYEGILMSTKSNEHTYSNVHDKMKILNTTCLCDYTYCNSIKNTLFTCIYTTGDFDEVFANQPKSNYHMVSKALQIK